MDFLTYVIVSILSFLKVYSLAQALMPQFLYSFIRYFDLYVIQFLKSLHNTLCRGFFGRSFHMVTHHDSISRCSSFLDYAWLRVIFLSLLLISNSVFAGPTGSGSENAVSLPAGCDVIGDYFGDGVEKCTADPATGAVKCFIAKVECCGNGRLDGEIRDASTGAVSAVAETCEVQTPGCRADCTMCGDNVINVDQGEVCDRGLQNGTAGSNCTQSCTVPVCGNGVWEDSNSNPVEECDGTSFKPQDQNKVGKVCGPSTDPATRCKLFYCGDGRIDNGETCDGDVFQTQHQGKPSLKCSNSCQVHFCGDGTKNNSPDCSTAGGASCSEQCDDSNSSNNDSCTNLCYTARCGDGFVQGDEECDGTEFSSQYSAKPGKSCDNQCQVHYCGDGTKDSSLGEECDDGNDSNYDSCTTACEPNVCGDGNPYTGVEQCDDGNTSNADLCTNACLPNVCGDGHLKTGVEQCDDKNLINNDGCSANCTPDCRPTDQRSVHIVPGAAHTVTIGTCPVYYQPIYVQGGANYPVNLSVSGYSGVSWAYISGNTLVYSKCIYPTTRWETYSHWVCTIWCCGGCHANYYYYDLHLQHSSAARIFVFVSDFFGSGSAHPYSLF